VVSGSCEDVTRPHGSARCDVTLSPILLFPLYTAHCLQHCKLYTAALYTVHCIQPCNCLLICSHPGCCCMFICICVQTNKHTNMHTYTLLYRSTCQRESVHHCTGYPLHPPLSLCFSVCMNEVIHSPPALHCTALHYTALHCTALHCTALYYTPLLLCTLISNLHSL